MGLSSVLSRQVDLNVRIAHQERYNARESPSSFTHEIIALAELRQIALALLKCNIAAQPLVLENAIDIQSIV